MEVGIWNIAEMQSKNFSLSKCTVKHLFKFIAIIGVTINFPISKFELLSNTVIGLRIVSSIPQSYVTITIAEVLN